MKILTASDTLKKFRKTPWKFQKTFNTPLKELDRFVSTAVSVHSPIESGVLTIEQIVFEAKNLVSLLSRYSIAGTVHGGVSVEAANEQEVKELIKAVLSDWTDFLFIPTPRSFAIYADHDEYSTFYGNTKGKVSRIVEALRQAGFSEVDYERKL